MIRALSRLAALAAVLLLAGAAHAIPKLQLYIDGATYDSIDETWITSDSTFDLWVVADPSVTNVMLSAAVSTSEALGGGSVTLTPTTTSLLSDPSTPNAPSFNGLSADGAVPTLSNGASLPTHGIYGTAGTSFLSWDLGVMSLDDSPCGDFIDAFPTTLNKTCTINVYSVSISGLSEVHFDVTATIDGITRSSGAIFAPFSHDGGTGGLVPEPSAALLYGVGALVIGVRTRRR